jgi:hypothetical protein
MTYGRGEFYYSQKWGALTAIADGTTTLTDVADALAAGTATPYEEALAAHYFAQAADYLVGVAESRVAEAERGHPVEDLADDDSELAVAEMRREFAVAARAEVHEVARVAVDREDDARRWAEAANEDEYHPAGATAALAADANDSWRKAVGVEYDQRCADYGNNGRPEDDRHISAEDKAAQAAAVAVIADRAGLPTGAVWDAVRDVTNRYALDHTDTATLDQPDWDQVADDWAALMDHNRANASGSEVPAWERDADQAAASSAELADLVNGLQADGCFGCEHVPGAVHCMTEDLSEPWQQTPTDRVPPDGEPPGKAGAVEAVATAHSAVEADTQRAAGQLAEQELTARAHTSEPARVTDVSEQAPTMEAGV